VRSGLGAAQCQRAWRGLPDSAHAPFGPRLSGPFTVCIALLRHFLRMKGFPLVTRWKMYSPKLLLLRNAGSLTPKLTYPKLDGESRTRKRCAIAHSRNSMVGSALLEFIGKLVGFFSLHVFYQFPLESCRSLRAHPFSCMLLLFHQPGTA
jgi:hypothetical protein